MSKLFALALALSFFNSFQATACESITGTWSCVQEGYDPVVGTLEIRKENDVYVSKPTKLFNVNGEKFEMIMDGKDHPVSFSSGFITGQYYASCNQTPDSLPSADFFLSVSMEDYPPISIGVRYTLVNENEMSLQPLTRSEGATGLLEPQGELFQCSRVISTDNK